MRPRSGDAAADQAKKACVIGRVNERGLGEVAAAVADATLAMACGAAAIEETPALLDVGAGGVGIGLGNGRFALTLRRGSHKHPNEKQTHEIEGALYTLVELESEGVPVDRAGT